MPTPDFTDFDSAITKLQAWRKTFDPPPLADTAIHVHAGDHLQGILDAAPEASVVALEPGVTWQENLRLTKAVTIRPDMPVAVTRRGLGDGVTKIIGDADETIAVVGDGVRLLGVDVHNTDPTHQIVGVTGGRFVLDACFLGGDPKNGQHRGLLLNGAYAQVLRSRITDIFLADRDTCALGGWDGSAHILVDDCYLQAAGMSVMFGGADSASAARLPTDITIARSTLTKNPTWFTGTVQIKNALELKAASRVLVHDCILEYAGVAQGQGAFLIVLTPRNQDGTAPWSTVENVTILNCVARYGGGCVQFLGTDNVNPSGTLRNIRIDNVLFDAIDPLGLTQGRGRAFEFAGGESVALNNLTVQGNNLSAVGYFSGPTKALALHNLKLPPATYGWKIDDGGMGLDALRAFMPDAIIVDVDSASGADLSRLPQGA